MTPGTQLEAQTPKVNGSCAAAAASAATPGMPNTLAISCGSAATAVVPRGRTVRTNSSTHSLVDSRCMWASTNPGVSAAPATSTDSRASRGPHPATTPSAMASSVSTHSRVAGDSTFPPVMSRSAGSSPRATASTRGLAGRRAMAVDHPTGLRCAIGRGRIGDVASVEIRPMGTGDVSQVVETWLAAAAELRLRLRHPATETTAVDRARIAGRIEHLLGTDPAGSWVAVDHDHRVVGLAQSFVRQSYWVLSLLAVDPRLQTSGVGRALLDRAMAHGAGCRGTIQVSMDPRAVRLYTTAGFELHPSMIAWGTLRPDRPGAPGTVRVGDAGDLDLVDDIDRAVRGAPRSADLRQLVEHDGATLLLDGHQAYAVVKPDRMITMAGRDESSASGILAAALALSPPGHFEMGWLTAPQQWAIRGALAAGLSLHPSGPVMVRGMVGPPTPYLPSGGFG